MFGALMIMFGDVMGMSDVSLLICFVYIVVIYKEMNLAFQ